MTREELNNKKQKEIFQEESRRKRKKIVILSFKIITIIIIISLLFLLYTDNISSTKIIVKESRLISDKLPDSFNGTKIVHFSDLHYGSNIKATELKRIVKLINSLKPDIVIFTGDLIDSEYKLNHNKLEKLIKELKKIDSDIGKYAVAGNEDKENYSTILNQGDFVVLNNSYDEIYKNNTDSILINGFSSSLKGNIDINAGLSYYSQETTNKNIFSIGIFHEPDSASDILSTQNIDLLLAGHSHNGYINIPFIGTISKVEGAKEYDQEYYEIDNSKLYISSGLGTPNNKIRLFCHPSINFIRLSNK